MKYKKFKSEILIFISAILVTIFITGCDSNPTTENLPATCSLGSNYTRTKFYPQYRYLDTLNYCCSIFSKNNSYDELKSAFDKAQITININQVSPKQIHQFFYAGDSCSDAVFHYRADLYYANYIYSTNNGSTWKDGYIAAIDSCHNYLDSIPLQAIGISQIGTFSIVFEYKILRMYDSIYYAVEANATHELGHQLGINGNSPHDGCGADNCIMGEDLTSDMYNNIHFCWAHMDTVWMNGKPFVKEISASERTSNFPNRTSKNSNFSFSISMSKDTFLECQSIHVGLKIKNLSMVKDSIATVLDQEDIALKNVITMKELPPLEILDFSRTPYTYFEPGEEKAFDFELLSEFSSSYLVKAINNSGAEVNDCKYIPSGKYSVVIGKKGILSNQLTFDIVKPEGQDLEELNEFRTALLKMDERYRIDNIYNFLIKYPVSKYYELALFYYTFENQVYTNDDWINFIKVTDKWFEKDTESEFARELIHSLGEVQKTEFSDAKKKMKQFFNKIKIDHPDTRISRLAQSYLELKFNNEK